MMLILASIAINLFIRMLYFIYKKRGDYDGLPDIKEVIKQKQAAKEREEKEAETPENGKKDITAE